MCKWALISNCPLEDKNLVYTLKALEEATEDVDTQRTFFFPIREALSSRLDF